MDDRIIVLPGAPLVRSGPYRFFSHPNYLIVVGEIAVLPQVFSLPYYALLFTIVNAILLFVRIRTETAALSALCSTANKTSPGPHFFKNRIEMSQVRPSSDIAPVHLRQVVLG